MESNLSDAGKCIRIAQEMRSINTKELCEKMGVQRQQMHRWRLSKNLKLHIVQQFAGLFGMSLDEFCKLDKM